MTYSTLASIVKYPFSSLAAGKKGKFGFFETEKALYIRVAEELGLLRRSAEGEPLRYARHPLVWLVEAADDICYEIMDLEDAHKLKIISYEDASRILLSFFDEDTRRSIQQRILEEGVTDPNEKVVYLRACVIGLLENECVRVFVDHEDEILSGTFEGSLIDHISTLPHEAYRQCSQMSVERIYRSKPVLDVELSGYQIIQTLMEQFVEAAVHPERFYSRQLIGRVSSQYHISAPYLETRLMAVIDYISGMTDVYALDEYQKIIGISLPVV
jgi:dGTPase